MENYCILVCPLDWVIGHASRCVPVISAFLKAGCRVIVAASGPGAALIKKEFEHQGGEGSANFSGTPEFVPFRGFKITYSGSNLFLKLLCQMPGFYHFISREKRLLHRLVQRFNPDLIVSDNRYGVVHNSVPSVLITHQLRPALPGIFKIFESPLSAVIRDHISNFNECWIPDHEHSSAAGRLVDGWKKLPSVFFIGWLSRFTMPQAARGNGRFRYRIMFLLSGIEPQRSILEKKITDRLSGTDVNVLLVRGLPGNEPEREIRGRMEIVSFMDSASLLDAINESEIVVCRSGYSSVMDLLMLGKRAVLVPTPGQTEQEYLGKWLSEKGWFSMADQKEFDPAMPFGKNSHYDGKEIPDMGQLQPTGITVMNDLLQIRVNELLDRISKHKHSQK